MSAGVLDLLIQISIFALVTLGLDFVVGYTKIFSVNQGLIFAVGAFSFVFVTRVFGSNNIFLAWLIAVLCAIVLSALIGIASLRVKGDAFVVVSFGAQTIGIQAIYNIEPISGGSSGAFGLPLPSVFGWEPRTLPDYLILVLVVGVIAYLLSTLIIRSPWGRVLRAVGEDDVATAAGGFNPRRMQISAFMLGGAFAAIAGVLYAGYLGTAQVSDFSIDVSISLIAMVVLGGAGRILGGLVGAIIFVGVPFLLDLTNLPAAIAGYVQQGIFGAALLAVVLFAPAGLTGGVSELIRRRSRHQIGFAEQVSVGAAADAVDRSGRS